MRALHPLLSLAFGLACPPVAALAAGAQEPADDHPAKLDRSGIRWELDFDGARERAERTGRLLFLVPDTFEPDPRGNMGIENFRVGVLCDERVRRLVNRMFVPYFFHVFDGTSAFDPEATKFVAAVEKEYGKETMTFHGGNPLLFMTAKGQEVGSVRSSTTADDALRAMQKVLEKNRRYAALSREEKALRDPLERGRLHLDRMEYRKAKAALRKDKSGASLLLQARIAREEGDWRRHAKLCASIDAAELADDVRVETGYRHWFAREFPDAAKHWSEVPAGHPRATEARYMLGAARLHQGDKPGALDTWKQLVEAAGPDGWVYRADWAYCDAKLGRDVYKSGALPEWPSLLGRRSYLGPFNPEVTGPPR